MKINEVLTPVYQVGGSVRDKLLGRTPKDLDYCTPLSPDEIEEAVRKAGRKPYLIGKKFGTIAFKLEGKSPREMNLVEVTTFRIEKYEKGNRKPTVTFVDDINHDLSRRDFTINAIAIREPNGKVIDPFNGITDLENKIIRCVGSPKARFKEDPLRILRCARFVSQLGFTVEEKTLEYMEKCAPHILDVSRERWMAELDKILMSNRPDFGIRLLIETKVMKWMIPELQMQLNYNQNSKYHNLTLLEHTLRVVKDCPKDLNLRWSALMHDIGKPFTRTDKENGNSNYIHHERMSHEIVVRYSKYLKWSNERTKAVCQIVKTHLDDDNPLKEYDNKHKKENKSNE